MKIVETSLKFNDTLSKRKKTDTIISLHSASKEAFKMWYFCSRKNFGVN